MGVGSNAPPPLIFIHGTNIVDTCLKVPFFGLFLLIFGVFFVGPFPGRG